MHFDAPEAGEYLLQFGTYQDKAGPENARLAILHNGSEIEQIDVAWEKPKLLKRTLTLEEGSHHIGLAYLNNYVNNDTRDRRLRGDRNLYVRDMENRRPAWQTSTSPA